MSDADGPPRLRVGRRVGQHVYLQFGPEPSDDDRPLFTVDAAVARWLVAAVELGEAELRYEDAYTRHVRSKADETEMALTEAYEFVGDARHAYRAAREAIR